MSIYDIVAKNGILKKGSQHSRESLKNLKLFDLVFIDDEIFSVAGFDENNEPFFADCKSEFVVE